MIVLARGGGSFEDLLPFSDERLVRAVAACAVPIVSAVGPRAGHAALRPRRRRAGVDADDGRQARRPRALSVVGQARPLARGARALRPAHARARRADAGALGRAAAGGAAPRARAPGPARRARARAPQAGARARGRAEAGGARVDRRQAAGVVTVENTPARVRDRPDGVEARHGEHRRRRPARASTCALADGAFGARVEDVESERAGADLRAGAGRARADRRRGSSRARPRSTRRSRCGSAASSSTRSAARGSTPRRARSKS